VFLDLKKQQKEKKKKKEREKKIKERNFLISFGLRFV